MSHILVGKDTNKGARDQQTSSQENQSWRGTTWQCAISEDMVKEGQSHRASRKRWMRPSAIRQRVTQVERKTRATSLRQQLGKSLDRKEEKGHLGQQKQENDTMAGGKVVGAD